MDKSNLQFISGDLFHSEMQTLVNPVNTVGVMGLGLALAFKKRYPAMYAAYRAACQAGEVQIGRLAVYRFSDHWVINFPTKAHFRNPSRLEYIEQGLENFCTVYQTWGVQSVAFPALGCGAGGLIWKDVHPVLTRYLSSVPIPIEIFVPGEEDATL